MKLMPTAVLSLAFVAPMAFAGGGTNYTVDDQVLANLHIADQGEIAVGTFVSGQAPDKPIVDFAQMLIKDHSDAEAQVAQIAVQRHVDLEAVIAAFADLDQARKDTQNELAQLKTLTGVDLERQFLQAESKDHKALYAKLVSIQGVMTQGSPTLVLVTQLLPTVKSHGDQADQLLQQLGH